MFILRTYIALIESIVTEQFKIETIEILSVSISLTEMHNR